MTSLIVGEAITYLCREEMENDCTVTNVALVFTSLPRMIASNTFALNEMRNQNRNSELKLPARSASLSCGRLLCPFSKEVVCFLTQRYIRFPHAWNEGDFEIAIGIPEFEQLKILLMWQ
ncbi:hypothetical protein T12_12681 [Trichinella patagoniensis]|uniref:Uncharacterized protein n=1 Tax=Trichinella patagoniensis TaxID=990121 RepID=A0A0V0YWG8_9BILA|nr:hypothetical protein T12_12681 [Trichinella patagoniensis]